MKKTLLLSLFFVFGAFSLLNAQSFDSTAWKYAKTINTKDIYKHLSTLASDNYMGRETGYEGQRMARRYLVEEFKKMRIVDLQNRNYVQIFSLLEQEGMGVEIEASGNTFDLNNDFLMSPSIVLNGKVEMEVVFVGYGIEDKKYNSYQDIDVKGKAVFFWGGTPKGVKMKNDWDTKAKIALAKKKGAIAVFYEEKSIKTILDKYKLSFEKPRMDLFSDDLKAENQFFVFRMNQTMAESMLKEVKLKYKKLKEDEWEGKKFSTGEIQLTIDKPSRMRSSENVLAYIPGTEKADEVVLITAHYDHLGVHDSLIYNGADDNGTGTSALLEMAQAFKKAADEGHRLKRSILIMAVSGEEKGLLGSRYYTDHPLLPLEKTVVDLNVDMIGRYDKAHRKDSNYVYLIGSDKLSKELNQLSEKVNKTYTHINLDYTFDAEDDPNRFYYRSDHYNFAKNNIPVIFYFSGVHEDYHKPTDTVDKIDLKKTVRISQLIFMTAWEIANREDRLKLDK